MAIKVAVTEPEFRKAEEVFMRAASDGFECVPSESAETHLAATVRQHGISYVIIGVEPYTGALYEAVARGGVIARFGVGHDALDKVQATAHGLLCTNTPGVLDDSVAELAMSLLLALARQLPVQSQAMHAGAWSTRMGREVRGKKLAVLGAGAIGRLVGRIAARGFGMEVVGFRRSLADAPMLRDEFGFSRVVSSFADAVSGADFVSLHLPSVPETRHFLDRSRLEALRRGCFLINTARGALIDENALYDALAAGQLGGAALDVFEEEPYRPRSPAKDLRTLDSVIMTPHIGSSTRAACDRMADRALRNIRLATEGKFGEMDLLNPEVLPMLCGSSNL